MTKHEASRLYRKVYRHLEKMLAGGLAYGMDWRTVRMLYPQHATVLADCLKVIQSA